MLVPQYYGAEGTANTAL